MTDAYSAGLAMLARGELSAAQVRQRLERKGFTGEQLTAALEKLQQTGALDDLRAAQALARRSAHVRMHGRLRALREIEGRGISRELARQAVDAVYAELDEQALLERALARHGRSAAADPAAQRRLYQRLVRQGFDGGGVVQALRRAAGRMANSGGRAD